MDYTTILQSTHLSQKELEGILIVAAGALVVGIMILRFWLHIVTGLLLCGAVTVFAHHPVEAAAEVNTLTNHSAFMSECMELTSGKTDMCEGVWKERQEDKK